MPGTLLHTYLTGLPGHFVPRNEMPRTCDPPERGAISARPFLSIVTRTQGRRMGPFRDVTASLAAQTDTDFEWLVIGHRLSAEERRAIEREIGDCPAWLRDRTRLIEVADGNRTKPLNAGYAAAAGAYIVSLDDDDMPLGHWVETFHALAASDPGKLLRTVAVRQDVRAVRIMEEDGVRAEGTLENLFAPEFDFLEHLDVNQTPNLAVAFPRGIFHVPFAKRPDQHPDDLEPHRMINLATKARPSVPESTPFTVSTRNPSACCAAIRQAHTTSPSTNTEHAPQSPALQPILTSRAPKRSRKA